MKTLQVATAAKAKTMLGTWTNRKTEEEKAIRCNKHEDNEMSYEKKHIWRFRIKTIEKIPNCF